LQVVSIHVEASTMRLGVIGCMFVLASLVALRATAVQQPTGKVYRIGWLTEGVEPVDPSFREALRVLGYVEGHNLFFERRHAQTWEQLPALAAELVTHRVDLIITHGTPATQAAKQATTTIPIVFSIAADPVQRGLVASFARPGGNLTGFTAGLYEDKLLEILKEAIPGIRLVACMCRRDPGNPSWTRIVDASRGLGLEIREAAIQGPEDLEPFFVVAHSMGADAVLVPDVAWFAPHLTRLGALAAQSGLPAIGFRRQFVEAGGLLSYGRQGGYEPRIAATYVDKLLQGAKPADLPVDQLMQFELIINLKTAKALGLTLPPRLLFQADEVIH
jgi:putative ABC transport system substrate-binding protein